MYIIFIVGVVFASTLMSNALYGTKLHWNVYILFTVGVVFAGKLVSSVNMELQLHWNVYILITVHVVFVGRLACSVNVLYMELSYTGSLARASEHVTVQISLPVRFPEWQVL